jgi:ABC-type enterobactin transport system permease subunit
MLRIARILMVQGANTAGGGGGEIFHTFPDQPWGSPWLPGLIQGGNAAETWR